jgi:hypothetical protein
MIIGNVGLTCEPRDPEPFLPEGKMNLLRHRRAVFTLLCIFASAPAFLRARVGAEELRTLVAGVATISPDNAEGASFAIGFDQSMAVLLPKDSPFIQGMEIEIKSPASVIAAPGGFAYELWRRIDPAPDGKRFAYRGERIIMQPLPARAGYAIQIPVRPDHSIKPSPYATLIPAIVEQKDFPFLFKLVPISKGLSAEVESAKFQVRVRPLLSDEGALSLKLRYPEGASERFPLVVTVDDRKVDVFSKPLFLRMGQHRLGVSSEAYRDENRSFAVEQGKTLDLVVELQDTRPILSIEAPDSAIVTLDGIRIDHAAHPTMTVEPGDHGASCRIGDYTLTRKFTAFRGKTYKLVLEIDLQVQEEPE